MSRALALACLILLAACGPKTDPATSGDVSSTVTRQPPVEPTSVPDADAAYLLRHTAEGTSEAIRLYEEALAADPARADAAAVHTRLSILYYGQAYYFDFEAPKKERLAGFLAGKQHGLAALDANAAWAEALAGGAKLQDSVHLLEAADVGGLYWAGLNWSRWGEIKGILRVALDIPKVRAMMERSHALSEDYYQAAPHRFFSAFFTALPGFAGQDVPRAEEHAKRAKEIAPGHTENEITEADYLAAHHHDRGRYERLLNLVLETPLPPVEDPYYFEFVVARRDAERLLADTDRRFP